MDYTTSLIACEQGWQTLLLVLFVSTNMRTEQQVEQPNQNKQIVHHFIFNFLNEQGM